MGNYKKRAPRLEEKKVRDGHRLTASLIHDPQKRAEYERLFVKKVPGRAK